MKTSIEPTLYHYLQHSILPQYDHYDKGHNRDHIEEVAAGAFELAENYTVNVNMLYAASQHIDVIFKHISEKYGEGGYLKLPILTQQNKESLAHLRALLSHEEAFKAHCAEVIETAVYPLSLRQKLLEVIKDDK